jgi:hypothetical protein
VKLGWDTGNVVMHQGSGKEKKTGKRINVGVGIMPNSDYDTMIKYGEWLQVLLQKNIRPWQLTKQFQEAITLLDLDYTVSSNDLSLTIIDKIEKQRVWDYYIYHAYTLAEKGDVSFIESFRDTRDPLRIYDFLSDLKENRYADQYPEHYFESVLQSVITMYMDRRFILSWLKGLQDNDVPWRSIPDTPPIGIEHLVANYNGIREWLNFDTIKGLHRVISFTTEYPHAALGIPTEVILSHIALKFLLLAEYDYFGFCGHCGSFFVVHRKGRKVYCSDICRANASKIRAIQ